MKMFDFVQMEEHNWFKSDFIDAKYKLLYILDDMTSCFIYYMRSLIRNILSVVVRVQNDFVFTLNHYYLFKSNSCR